MNGYYNFFASAGLNSVTIRNTGTKQVEFPDGHAIKVNSPVENFHGTFMGEIRHETVGVLNYSDNEGYKCDVKFGEARRKPSDLLTG